MHEVRVGHHHHVVFGPSQGLHPFAQLSTHLIQVVGNRGGADKAQSVHSRVLHEGFNHIFVALDDAENPIR